MNPGQRLILGLKEPYLSDTLKSFFKSKQIGGFILFNNNSSEYDQLKSLIGQLYDISDNIPFIGIDYEGGTVCRLGQFFQTLDQPSGYVNNLSRLKNQCQKVGKDFRNIGINLNFAPVADLTYSPLNPALKSRTFSDDPSAVAEYCQAFIEGFSESDILCCLKHFPGLGSAVNDPHHRVAISCLAKERILNYDLLPFKAGIDAGIKMIMTTHLMMTELNSEIATFSRNVVNLARRLGFNGIIISDDLSMSAVKTGDTLPETVLKTLCCGHDMTLVCHDYDMHDKIITYLENNLDLLEENGHDEALKRVNDVKKSWLEKYN